MYPGNQEFLDNVRAEAEDNVRRLRNHPSIAIWSGNNEIEGADELGMETKLTGSIWEAINRSLTAVLKETLREP
jgi:beta-galactosidase/beta-glucuronidase